MIREMPGIELSSVRKSFGATEALRSVSFHVAPGERASPETARAAHNSTCSRELQMTEKSGMYLADATEAAMPAEIRVTSHRPSDGARVTLVGTTSTLEWKADGENGFVVSIPPSLRAAPPCQ